MGKGPSRVSAPFLQIRYGRPYWLRLVHLSIRIRSQWAENRGRPMEKVISRSNMIADHVRGGDVGDIQGVPSLGRTTILPPHFSVILLEYSAEEGM